MEQEFYALRNGIQAIYRGLWPWQRRAYWREFQRQWDALQGRSSQPSARPERLVHGSCRIGPGAGAVVGDLLVVSAYTLSDGRCWLHVHHDAHPQHSLVEVELTAEAWAALTHRDLRARSG
ncbi:MAG: hypothetical protein JWP14_3407 [Frankiales bacterium]|nr:hypothetical protein [Frankiales bacterium]